MRSVCTIAFVCVAAFTSPLAASAQSDQKDSASMVAVSPAQISALRWRHVDLPHEPHHGQPVGAPVGGPGAKDSPALKSVEGSQVRSVAEDPLRKGLLFAGTDRGVYVSFDRANHFQSLQLNMPAASVRHLFIQQNALFAGTEGHGLWIIDDLAPLRQIGADSVDAPSFLFKPSPVMRASNPASGAAPAELVFYYELKSAPARELTLEIHDSHGKSVRRFTSFAGKTAAAEDAAAKSASQKSSILSKNIGLNRFAWDLRSADGGFIEPGQYEAIFIGNDSLMKQPVSISIDSRTPELQALELKRIDSGITASATAIDQMTNLRNAIADRVRTIHTEKPSGKAAATQRLEHGQESAAALHDLDSKVTKIFDGDAVTPGLLAVHRGLSQARIAIQAGMIPDPVNPSCSALETNLAAWRDLDAHAVPETSTLIAKSSLAALPTATVMSIMAMPQESSASGGCAP
jgi:hypothetical protein